MKSLFSRMAVLIAGGVLFPFGGAFADVLELPVVSIEATRRVAEETAAPLRRINLVGEFTVTRTGETEFALPVWVHVSGSATPGADYDALPWLVNIPVGASSVRFPVRAFSDSISEGIETVIAQVSHCPPVTKPPLGAPCYLFAIDPLNDRDTVFIREDGLSIASVHITTPVDGEAFASGAPVMIRALTIHLESTINRVAFLADGTRIGGSEIQFIRAPDPGTPIQHEFEWPNPAPGKHVLTVREDPFLPKSDPAVSSPVRISVGASHGNDPPAVAMTSPSTGASFPAGASVALVVETRDPDGYVPRMAFFADGRKIGERNVNFFAEPPPNQLQTFQFTWEDPMPGLHTLTARATDNDGASSGSAPVSISIALDDSRPTVRVVARDAFAVEPTTIGTLNTATFRIQRFGVLHGELQVRYSMHGRADNGIDYETLSGTAVIQEGHASVDVIVAPLADDVEERMESVILLLNEDPAYRISPHRRALALISDRPWEHPNPGPHCRGLKGGLVHLCFPAPHGGLSRLETSPNLRDWSTSFDLTTDDGSVHVVDEATPGAPVAFRRISSGP
jgi:hypothetical protein